MDQDLGLTENPDDYAFDELVGQIDYHLCAIKDVQIRDGLHVLSEAPTGEGLLNLVLAILRAGQIFGGRSDGIPGLRVALGHDEIESGSADTDAFEATARELVGRCADAHWEVGAVDGIVLEVLGEANAGVSASLTFACREAVSYTHLTLPTSDLV